MVDPFESLAGSQPLCIYKAPTEMDVRLSLSAFYEIFLSNEHLSFKMSQTCFCSFDTWDHKKKKGYIRDDPVRSGTTFQHLR